MTFDISNEHSRCNEPEVTDVTVGITSILTSPSTTLTFSSPKLGSHCQKADDAHCPWTQAHSLRPSESGWHNSWNCQKSFVSMKLGNLFIILPEVTFKRNWLIRCRKLYSLNAVPTGSHQYRKDLCPSEYSPWLRVRDSCYYATVRS